MNENKETPNGWVLTTVDFVFDKISNGANVTQYEETIGLPISRIETIWNETIDFKRVKYIKENDKEFIEKYALKNNDILFSHINSDSHLGKTAIFKKRTDSTLIHGINLLLLRTNKLLNADFINYQFKYLRFRGAFAAVAQKAVNQSSINQAKLKQFKMLLPPLPEQHRTVAKIEELFSSLDKGIESLKTAQQQLKVYRQSVLKWAFEGKLTNKNVKDGELPDGWKQIQIKEIAEINPKIPDRENISKQMEVQFLPMKLVEAIINKIHLTEIRQYQDVLEGSYTPFINGDVIFAKVTPCMENGKIAIVDNLKNGIGFGSSEFHVVRAGDKVMSKFIFNYLVQDRFRQEAANEMTGAVGLRRVPKQFIENYSFPLPSLEEQNAIVAEIESRLSVCDKIEESIEQSLKQSKSLRQSILKKAFEGKLVLQDTNDEPASKLLERIRAEKEALEKKK